MKETSGEPWVRYRETGLYAVPSIHHRQVFAQLVFEACFRKRFDVIAVEFPPSHGSLLEAALRLAPAPGLIIQPTGGKIELMRVPVSDEPDCKETRVKPVKRGLMFPLTACDSMVMALRCPQLLQNHWPGWEPEIALVDDEMREGERPRMQFPFRDDYEVMESGLAAFYQRMEPSFQSARAPQVDERRERVMGSRLRRLLDEGKQVLFVCGAAHWKHVCEYLDSGVRETLGSPRPAGTPRLILAPFEPAIAWLWGWLDDIPRVAWALESACQGKTPLRFDKREAVQTVVREAFTQAQAVGLPISLRRLLNMERYLETLASTAGHWVPELDDHLVHAAAVCVEERFAESLKKKALEYPSPLPPGVEMAQVRPYAPGKWFVLAEGELFLLELPSGGGKRGGRRISLPAPAKLNEREEEEFEDSFSGTRDWPEEQRLVCMMNLAARQVADRQEQVDFARKFTGSMGAGLDWRRTIRARASGDKVIYVRQARSNSVHSKTKRQVVTPIVWIFDDQSPLVERTILLGWLDDFHDPIVSASYLCEEKFLAEGRIQAWKLGAFVDLGHGRAFLGEQRPSLLSAEQEVEAFLNYSRSVPKEKLCFIAPWNDPELARFAGVDQATATGVKYAEDKMILVSRSGLPVASAVERYASQKGVTIQRVSTDHFERKRLDRFQWLHLVPRPDVNGSAPYDWCSRFIPPI